MLGKSIRAGVFKVWSPDELAASVLPGSLLEMQSLGPYPGLLNQKLRMKPSNAF